MFIGRFQPFHDGHKTLIQTLLDEGREVIVAIRDTETSESNPYSFQERINMVLDAFPDIAVILIPDIEEVVYGRDVGYGIRKVSLPEDVEAISATKIREQND